VTGRSVLRETMLRARESPTASSIGAPRGDAPARTSASTGSRCVAPRSEAPTRAWLTHVRQLHVRDGRAGRHPYLRGGVPQHAEGAPPPLQLRPRRLCLRPCRSTVSVCALALVANALTTAARGLPSQLHPCRPATLPPCRPAAPPLALSVTFGRGLARAARGHLAPQPVHHPRRARHGRRVCVGHSEHAPQHARKAPVLAVPQPVAPPWPPGTQGSGLGLLHAHPEVFPEGCSAAQASRGATVSVAPLSAWATVSVGHCQRGPLSAWASGAH
jgi:hypothetical protein